MAAADEAQAEGELQDTTERQLAEIDEQMQAWSRVSTYWLLYNSPCLSVRPSSRINAISEM